MIIRGSLIKDALEIDARITELIAAHSDNLKIFSSQLRGLDDELDKILVDIGLDLIPLTENIHLYNDKLSDFILRTEKRKRENKQLMSIANKVIKEQDYELKSLLLSNHQIYHHTIKEQKTGNIKFYPWINNSVDIGSSEVISWRAEFRMGILPDAYNNLV